MSKLKAESNSMMAMIAVAIATRPKSAGTSKRASMTRLTIPIERSRSLNTTIHAAPRAILDPRLAAIQGEIWSRRHRESRSVIENPLLGSATLLTSGTLHEFPNSHDILCVRQHDRG